jgi:hypothetical protein
MGVIILFIIWNYFYQKKCNLRIKKSAVLDETIQKNIETADEYEIAYLIGGEDFARIMAFNHLLKSGYYEKVGQGFDPNTQKDPSPLSDFEKAMLTLRVTSRYGEFIFLGDYALTGELLKKYKNKLSEMDLFYEKKPDYVPRATLFYFLILVLIFSCVPSWGSINWLNRAGIIAFIFIAVFLFKATKNLEESASIFIRRKTDNKLIRVSFSNHIVTQNGKEYVSLFEKHHYPLDQKLEEAWALCPCSLIN